MGTDQKNLPSKDKIDDVERIKRVAFWYWEYMRRNRLYRRYCDVINKYDDFFKQIGVYSYMQSKEYLEEMTDYVSSHDDPEDLKYTPFRKYIESEYGHKAGLIFFKYGFLSIGFEMKFGRIFKDYSVGIDSHEIFEILLNGKEFEFSTDNLADISAITKLNKSWTISIEDDEPCVFYYDYNKFSDIKIKPEAILSDPEKVGLEVHALHLTNKAVQGLFEKQKVSSETLTSVYRLSLSGKHINSSDIMRVAMLWIWDEAHNLQNPGTFEDIYPLLKDKVEAHFLTGKPWDEILTRKARLAGYYQSTQNCIENLTVTPLGPKSS